MVMTITTPQQFTDWLKGGPRICVYHTGNLAETRYLGNDPALGHLAKAVWAAAINREVYLVQRRPAGRDFNVVEYLAIRPAGKVPMRFAPGLSGERQS